jgi:HSP20 family protein
LIEEKIKEKGNKMAIIRWEPFRMEDFPEFRLPRFGSDMAVDVYEKGNNVVAEMNLPGVDPNEIDIDIEDDYVQVTGQREEKVENADADYYYQEIQRGSFERTFRLPTKVEPMGANADFEDGVLTITMPIAQGKQTQKVKPVRKTRQAPKSAQPKTEEKTKPAAKKAPAKKPAPKGEGK